MQHRPTKADHGKEGNGLVNTFRKAEAPPVCAMQTGAERTSALATVAVATSGTLGLAAYLLALTAGAESAAIGWSGVALACLGVAAMLFMGRPVGRSLATLRLGPWFALGFAVTFGLATLGVAFPHGEATERTSVYVDSDLAKRSVPLLALFIGASAIAYQSFPEHWSREISRFARRQARSESLAYFRPLLLLGIGVGATLALIRAGTYGYASDAASLVESAAPSTNVLTGFSGFTTLVAYWMAWRAATTRDLRAGILCLSATVLGLTFGLMSGMKEYAALPLLAAAFGWSSARLKLNWLALLAFGAVFVAFIYPVVNAYRVAVTTGSGRLTGTEGTSQLADVLDARSETSKTGDAFASRLARLPDFSVIMSLTPDVIPYRAASELLMAPVLGVVPRAVWPEKPILSTGYKFSYEYYGLDSRIYTSSAVTPEGDLFRHGGWILLLIGGGVIGLFLRTLDSTSDGTRDPRLYFLPISIFPLVVKHEMDFIGLVAALPTALVVVGVALKISGRRRSETGNGEQGLASASAPSRSGSSFC